MFWNSIEVSKCDALEQELLQEIMESVPKAKALSTWDSSYISHINRFIQWCKDRNPPRCPLPASESTVTLYLQFLTRSAKSYAVVKSASGAIFSFHEAALVPQKEIPTQLSAPSLVREVAEERLD